MNGTTAAPSDGAGTSTDGARVTGVKGDKSIGKGC